MIVTVTQPSFRGEVECHKKASDVTVFPVFRAGTSQGLLLYSLESSSRAVKLNIKVC